jgi:hypothetical protein
VNAILSSQGAVDRTFFDPAMLHPEAWQVLTHIQHVADTAGCGGRRRHLTLLISLIDGRAAQ